MFESPTGAYSDGADRFMRLGSVTAVAVFGGLFVWSAIAPISSAVIAPGRISVETSRKTVQHLEGGVIKEILVAEGSAVAAGDLLIRLEDTVPRANAAVLSEQLAERIARLARLLAEREDLEQIPTDSRAFDFAPPGLDYSENLDGQKRLLAARVSNRKTQIALLDERIVQQGTKIEGHRKQIRSMQEQLRLIGDELEGVKKLNSEGFAPMTRVRELERMKEEISGRQGQLAAAVAESESLISSSRLEIVRLLQQTQEDAIKESQDVEVEIANLVERRAAVLDMLDRTEIRAPESGVVLGLSVHTIGGVISPGQPIMEIVPGSDGLLIAAQISPRDVDKVHTGQETVIRFSAFNARVTPEARGRVRQVSADNIVDKATGQAYYLVLIDLPPTETLERALGGRRLVPGMPTENFIRTGSRPAISYLVKPLTDALSRSMRED